MTGLLHWLVPWEFSPTVIGFAVVTALLYLRGTWRTRLPVWRQGCFWLGFVLLYAMCQTQFDYVAEHAFFVHRLQHAVLHHLGPFLIVLSRPGITLAAGMPARLPWRWILRLPATRGLFGVLNHPPFGAAA